MNNFTVQTSFCPSAKKKADDLIVRPEVGSDAYILKTFAKSNPIISVEDTCVQEINLNEPFTSSDFVLLEVDSRIADSFSSGESLIVRGHPEDNIVLCTSNESFQVKEIESSNTYLLVNGLDGTQLCDKPSSSKFSQCLVFSIYNCFLEALKFIPTASKQLRHFFNLYAVDIYDNDIQKWHSVEQLLDVFQMSKEELDIEIFKHPILVEKDKLCFLNDKCRWKLLDELIDCYESISNQSDTIHSFVTFDLLREKMSPCVCDAAINWVVGEFCAPLNNGSESSNSSIYSLAKDKVCQNRAEQLLKLDPKKEWHLEEFRNAIEMLLPYGFKFELFHLRGIAFLSDSIVYGKLIKPLIPSDLPVDVEARLKELFSLQKVWKADELAPYLVDCCSDIAKREEFLMKHCRIVRRSGEKLYSLKNLKM